ncbi:MAG: GNAT family N-acetyltransferase [Planctomycetaceae bacterium]|nr:GNAT family N-acetyltransferase [Planctomycetaceae bacterium]
MFESLGNVKLKDGRSVERGVVVGPDEGWAKKILPLLGHKGGVWNWQNERLLTSETPVNPRFFVLCEDGRPFANVMTCDVGGVGLLGHVYTDPARRRLGASSLLMESAMADFAARDGQAMFLGTGYDSPPWHIYRRFGFEDIEPPSGYMAWYAKPQAAFEEAWFAPGPVRIEALGWKQWVASVPLFLADQPPVVRCAPLRLMGRELTEGVLLPLLQEEIDRCANHQPPAAVAMASVASGAMVGFAAWRWHPMWPGTVLVDVYCHSAFWDRGGDLLAALPLPPAQRYEACSDSPCPAKAAVLAKAGFVQTAVMPGLLPAARRSDKRVDVTIWSAAAVAAALEVSHKPNNGLSGS